ncbi:alpha/beta hydrolase family esterase [Luedemannella flava]
MPTGAPGSTVSVDLDGRPFRLHIPTGYVAGTKVPLVVALHGFTSNAAEAESYFKLTGESDRRGFLYAMPDGTRDSRGDQFWDATDACCGFYADDVDDSGYLHRLIGAVKSAYSVDPDRVAFIGHSNGGFMAYRMACDHAAEISAIVSLAGAMTDDPARCTPSRPVSVLQIHGTADATISFTGGANGTHPYPSAAAGLDVWRRVDGCGDAPTSAAPLDLDSSLTGAETTVTSYRTGCRAGTRVELWAIAGGGHVPALTAHFPTRVVDFLLSR